MSEPSQSTTDGQSGFASGQQSPTGGATDQPQTPTDSPACTNGFAGPTEDSPRSKSEVLRLEKELCKVQNENYLLNEALNHLEQLRNHYYDEKKRFGLKTKKLRNDIDRLEGLLKDRELEFSTQQKESNELISSQDGRIASLVETLQVRKEKMENIQQLSHKERQEMTARLEAEAQKVTEQANEILKLQLENRRITLLQNDLQNRMNLLEQQLNDKETKILTLREEKDIIFSKFIETTKESLQTSSAVESDKAWKEQYLELKDNLREELARREQKWEVRFKQVEEEKKEVEDKGQHLTMRIKQLEAEKKEQRERCVKLQRRGFAPWERYALKSVRKKKEDKEMKKKEKEEREMVYKRVKEVTSQLRTTLHELFRNDAVWQAKLTALQEKFSQELAEKEQEWQEAMEQLEEEKKQLEALCQRAKKKRFWPFKRYTRHGFK